MLLGPLPDGLGLLQRVHGAGRVGRGDEQHDLGARGARSLKLLHSDEITLVGTGEHGDRDAASELDDLRVRRPVRRGDEDLVARVEQRSERLEDRVLAAVGHDHLGRCYLKAAVTERLGRHCLAQFR